MPIDSTIHAIVDQWHEMCPSFTIQGTNETIIVRYQAHNRVEQLIVMQFDGCFIHISYDGTANLFTPFPKAVDLNNEKDLKTLEDALKELAERSDPVV